MSRKSDITMHVEMLPGTSIENAVEQAKELAIKLNIAYIDFSFNGVNISVGRNAVVEKSLDAWKSVCEDGRKSLILN